MESSLILLIERIDDRVLAEKLDGDIVPSARIGFVSDDVPADLHTPIREDLLQARVFVSVDIGDIEQNQHAPAIFEELIDLVQFSVGERISRPGGNEQIARRNFIGAKER